MKKNSGDFLKLSLSSIGNSTEKPAAEKSAADRPAADSPSLINLQLTIMKTSLTVTSPLLTLYTGYSHTVNGNGNGNESENENTRAQALARSPRGRAPLAQGQSETVPPPFPWATDRRATVHCLEYLMKNNIVTISGQVQCKKCDESFEMKLDLEEKFSELLTFIEKNKGSMHDRAPKVWGDPVLPTCEHCGRENSVAPFLADTKKKAINWLFLFLAQMLGCCTIKQLKYFCKHTNSHRTGAKDRLVYSAYMTLCQQLLPKHFNS